MESAVILAGGKGTRLRPLTNDIPKPLVEVDERNLTEHKLLMLKEAGIETVYLAVGYMSEKVKDFFGDEYAGMRIKYIVEEEPLGTGGWMRLVDRDDFGDDFIVTNADDLSQVDFDAMLELHEDGDALVTVSLSEVDDPTAYGVVDIEDGWIRSFSEKPDTVGEAPSNLVSDGHYIFSPEVFEMAPDREKFMLEYDVFPRIVDEGRLLGYRNDALWLTTNTLKQLEHVRENWDLPV